MAHVFISYKRDDKEFVAQLEQKIKEADIPVWTDAELNAGENWRDKIDEAITAAFAIIVVVTPASLRSSYVTYEWSYAMGLGKTIIPVVLKKFRKIHPKLEELEHIDCTAAHPYTTWDDIIDRIREIVDQETYIPIPDNLTSKQRGIFAALNDWSPRRRQEGILALRALSANHAVPSLVRVIKHENDIDTAMLAVESLRYFDIPERYIDDALDVAIKYAMEARQTEALVNVLLHEIDNQPMKICEKLASIFVEIDADDHINNPQTMYLVDLLSVLLTKLEKERLYTFGAMYHHLSDMVIHCIEHHVKSSSFRDGVGNQLFQLFDDLFDMDEDDNLLDLYTHWRGLPELDFKH